LDARRFVDLYAAEAREHLRLLSRSITELESPGAAAAVGEAFRAAHTLKGIAAAMGHQAVASQAHAIEDSLDAVRAGRARADEALTDELLARIDELEQAIDASIAAPPLAASVSEARVRLSADTALPAARASLIVMTCRRSGLIASADPDPIDDDFTGELHLVPAPGVTRDALERAVRGCGDVEQIVWDEPVQAAGNGAVARPVVRVDVRRLDALADGISELLIWHARMEDVVRVPQNGAAPELARRRFRTLLGELQEEVLHLRMFPVGMVFERMPRVVREAARAVGKSIRLTMEGTDIELDRALLDELVDPIVHLLRNAVDHGIEKQDERARAGKPARAEIRLCAERERASVRIEVHDDGRGMARERIAEKAATLGLRVAAADAMTDEELLRVLAHPGLSTADEVTEVSGRGVGMDAVVQRIRTLGGALSMRSEEGAGTTFTMRLPLTLALAHALRVRVGPEDYAIPLTHVCEVVELQDVHVAAVGGRETLRVRDDLLPLVRLRQVLGIRGVGTETAAVIAENGERRAALAVDALLGREQIVMKGYVSPRDALPLFSGATLLADGRPALVLDPLSVV
jgi:two-component system chemotaxis sensor kinase CheA